MFEQPDGDLLVSFRNISTIVRIDRKAGTIAWRLGAPPLAGQHGPHLLPNGNTLVNEGNFGRMFEVTTGGEVVWEYVNPHFGPAALAPKLQQNSVFRAYRYSEDEIGRAQAATT